MPGRASRRAPTARVMLEVVRSSLLLVLLTVSAASPAEAHRLKAFASVEGTTINGSAYFPGMGVARGVEVRVLAPDGTLLAKTTTNDQGHFTVTARQRIDHRVVVDSGDGHRAEYLVRAGELPESLAASPGVPADAAAAVASAPAPLAAAAVPVATAIGPELEAAIDRAVARHVRPLREQIDAFQSAIGFRDVLGGLGWIVGVTGIVLWLIARRNG